MDQNALENAILYAIDRDFKKIVNYFFDNLDKIKFFTNIEFINKALMDSFMKKTDEFLTF